MHRETHTDFDSFVASVATFHDRFLATDKGEWRWSLEGFAVDKCYMQRSFSHAGIIAEGCAPLDGYGFYVPWTGDHWTMHGIQHSLDDLYIVEPGSEVYTSCRPGDGWNCFFVPRQIVDERCELDRDPLAYSYVLQGGQRQRANVLRSTIGKMVQAINQEPSIEFSPAMKVLQEDMLSLMLPLLELEQSPRESREARQMSRREVIWRAQDIIERHKNQVMHVNELARLVGVCDRSLQVAFQEFYNMSPKAYLLLRQLHQVRHDLRWSNSQETTVAQILTRWGIWEFGRFAGRYKRHFGELPSQTLSRSR